MRLTVDLPADLSTLIAAASVARQVSPEFLALEILARWGSSRLDDAPTAPGSLPEAPAPPAEGEER